MSTRSFLNTALWSLMQRYIPSMVQIITMLLITRLISPSDYGEVAIITTLAQIAILFVSSGLSEGLMYKVDNSNLRYSSVFYLNIIIAIVLYFMFFVIAPFLAEFYNIERLVLLTRIVSINILLYAFSYLQRTLYQKNLEFKRLAKISILASCLSSVTALCLGYAGFGVWAIVFLTLCINFIETLLLWGYSKWRPVLSFSFAEISEILPYSMRILMNNLIQSLYDNAYSLILGKTLGSRPLGFYNRMQTVVYYTTTNFMYSIESVFFPKLCIDKDNKDLMIAAYKKLLGVCFTLCSFILTYLMLMGSQVIMFILGEKWLDGASVLNFLSCAFLFVPISYINNSFLKLYNQTSILLKSNAIKKILGCFILVVTISIHDLEIVCLGLILYYFLDALISIYCTKVYVGISYAEQYRSIIVTVVTIIVTTSSGNIIFPSDVFGIPILISGFIYVVFVFFAFNFILKTVSYTLLRNIMCK